MDYMPYAGLTDNELLLDVYNDRQASAREIELTQRIEQLQEKVEGLEGYVDTLEGLLEDEKEAAG